MAQTLRFPDSRSLSSLPTGVGVRLDESPTPSPPMGGAAGRPWRSWVRSPTPPPAVMCRLPLPFLGCLSRRPPHPPCEHSERSGGRGSPVPSHPPPEASAVGLFPPSGPPDPFPPIPRRAPFDRSYPMAYAMGYGADPAFYPPGGQMAMPPPGYDFPHFPGVATIPPPPWHIQRAPNLSVSIVYLSRFTHMVRIVYRCTNALPKKHT